MMGWLKHKLRAPAPVTRVIEAHSNDGAVRYETVDGNGRVTFSMLALEST